MDRSKEELLRSYLDNELNDEQQQKVLHMIADDAEMRSLLQFEHQLRARAAYWGDPESFKVPAGFSDRVMDAIGSGQSETALSSAMAKVKYLVEFIWFPKQINFRPAYALGVLLVLITAIMLPLYTGGPPREPLPQNTAAAVTQAAENGEQVWMRFVFIDNEAKSIAVAGDFNNWNPAELSRQTINGDQVWTALVAMDRGEHRYMFVKDGQKWVTDPLAAIKQKDGFGNKNAVVYL